MISRRTVTLSLAFATATFLSAHGAALADPPARVGRLSYIGGTVSFHTPDQQQWSPAELNYPVTTGASFWTEPKAKAEIQVGGTEIRLDEATEADITELDDNGTQIAVPQGVVNVHLREVPANGIQIQTPNGIVSLTKPGSYHIDSGHADPANPNVLPATTQVTVLEGEASINAANTNAIVMPGEEAVINTNPPSFSLVEGNSTPFDDWALSRERREVASQTSQYIPPQVTGYEDLDAQGSWLTNPDYGPVWYPNVIVSDWAPYRYGHWAFVSPWGWTWIDDAPWGFAPFHYGRWVNDHGRWGWCPGERVARPVYAPALVAFVGGSGFNVTVSLGRSAPAVGWVPLAPHEVFHPYYKTSVDYARNINSNNVNKTVINNITVNNIHENITVNHYANAPAATVVSSNAFTHGAAVHKSAVAVPAAQLAKASVAPDVSHFTPVHENKTVTSPAPVPHHFAMPEHNEQVKAPVQPATPEAKRAPMENVERLAAPGPAIQPRVIRGAEPVAEKHEVTAVPAIQRPEVTHPAEVQRPAIPAPQVKDEHKDAPKDHAVNHPEQHGEIKPTHEGWQRVPPAQPKPEEKKAPELPKDEHKNEH